MSNEKNENEVTSAANQAPGAPKPADRRALSAYRHGLTGQIVLLTQADQVAYDKHCRGYHQSLAPGDPVETDLVQSIADDRWRLKRATAIEAAIFADGITEPDETVSGHAEVDAALAHGRVWLAKGGNLQLLSLYENRIQRRFERTMVELRTLQAARQAALERALEEADLLTQLAESKGESAEPWIHSTFAKFDFSSPDVARMLVRLRRLRQARKQFPVRKIAA